MTTAVAVNKSDQTRLKYKRWVHREFWLRIFLYIHSEYHREKKAALSPYKTYIRRYIIGHNKPFSQDYGLASHTTYVVCINFIRDWQDLQSNVASERQIFEKPFHGRLYLLSEFKPKICCEVIAEEIGFFFHTSFWGLTWATNSSFMSNKPTRYLLD